MVSEFEKALGDRAYLAWGALGDPKKVLRLRVGARPPIGWLRAAMVAVLGNPGSGKVSECPRAQLFAGTFR